MSTDNLPSTEATEALLDAAAHPGTGPAPTDPLSRVLAAAARGTDRPGPREQALLAEFRSARDGGHTVQHTQVLPPHLGGDARRRGRRRLALPAAAASALVLLGGAAAASTFIDRTPRVFALTGATAEEPLALEPAHAAEPSARPTSRPATTKGAPAGLADGRLTRGERERMFQICRAWVAQGPAGQARDAATSELYRAAGGADRATAFCGDVADGLCSLWAADKPATACPFTLPTPRATTVRPAPTTRGNGVGKGHGKGKPTMAPTRPPAPTTDPTVEPLPPVPGITGGPVTG